MGASGIDPEHFRAKLVQQRAALRDAAAGGNADANVVELDQQRQGRLSRIDALGAQAMTREAQRRRREAVQRCDAALQRIDDGDYGRCLHCGGAIDPRRLEFDPAAQLCIDCASRAER